MDDDWKTWDTLARRVRGRRRVLKLTQVELAAASGLNQGDISKIERGEIQQTTKLPQLARALQCDPWWLAEGGTAPPRVGGFPAKILPPFERDSPTPVDMDAHPELTRIRSVKLRLQAGIEGYAVEPEDGDGLPIFFRADWMAQRGFKPYDLLAIKVRGGSMEPSLHEGDMVVINTVDKTPRDGEVFAVNYEGESVIKRLVRDGGEWWLASDNPDQRRYPRKKWVDGDSFIVGRVVHKQSERI